MKPSQAPQLVPAARNSGGKLMDYVLPLKKTSSLPSILVIIPFETKPLHRSSFCTFFFLQLAELLFPPSQCLSHTTRPLMEAARYNIYFSISISNNEFC